MHAALRERVIATSSAGGRDALRRERRDGAERGRAAPGAGGEHRRGQVHVPAAAGPGVPRVAPGGRAGGAVAEGGGGRRGGSRLRQPPAAAVPGAVPLVLHLPDLLLPGPAEGAAGEAGRARGTRAGVREVRVQRQVRRPAATPRVPCGRSSPTAASTPWPSQPGRCQAIALLRLCMMPRYPWVLRAVMALLLRRWLEVAEESPFRCAAAWRCGCVHHAPGLTGSTLANVVPCVLTSLWLATLSSLSIPRYVFAKNLFETGHLDMLEWAIYQEWHSFLLQELGDRATLHGFLYLRATPQRCLERLWRRARVEERGVQLLYLQQLHTQHEHWLLERSTKVHFADMRHMPVLVLDVDGDFEQDAAMQDILMAQVESFVKSLQNKPVPPHPDPC